MSALAELQADMAAFADQPAPIGHNMGPEPTPYELAKNAIEALAMEGAHWLDGGKVASEVEATSIAMLMDNFRRASKEADEARKVEAKPFDDGKAEVQGRYNPLLQRADTAIKACKAALAPWLIKLETEKREAADRARQAAEKAQREAAEALLTAAPNDLAAREAADALAATAKRATTQANVAGRDRAQATGGARATTLRTSWVPSIVNGVEVARHYWQTDQAACEAFFLTLAEADVRSGKRQIPGVIVEEVRSVV